MAGETLQYSALFSRKQPGGVYTIADILEHPGKVYFVDSGHANAVNSVGAGRRPDKPWATLAYAFSSDVVAAGDVVYVMPGHAENLAAADAIAMDIAGVTVIGIGKGNRIPTFSATAAAGEIDISAANITLKNLRLTCNFTGGSTAAIAIAAAGDGCTLDGVQFRDTLNTKEWLIHVSVATTVTDLTIRNCSFIGLTGGSMTNSILFAGSSTDTLIEDNVFHVDSSDDVIDHLTTAAVNHIIRRNIVVNMDTDAAGYCVRTHASSTGIVHDNRFAYNKVDAEISSGAATWWLRNFASNTIAESDLLDPTTAHAIP